MQCYQHTCGISPLCFRPRHHRLYRRSTSKREETVELRGLDSPSYGVSIPGIYIIDDDGEQVCAGPFDSEIAAIAWIDRRQENRPAPAVAKLCNALTGCPRRPTQTDRTSGTPNIRHFKWLDHLRAHAR